MTEKLYNTIKLITQCYQVINNKRNFSKLARSYYEKFGQIESYYIKKSIWFV